MLKNQVYLRWMLVMIGTLALMSTARVANADLVLVKPPLNALCVGINKYADRSINLNYATQDAIAVKNILALQNRKLPGSGGIGFQRSVSINLLTDEQATAPNILQGLDDLIAKSITDQNEHATYVIYFSGQGTVAADGKTFYFLSHEAVPKNLDETGLKWSEVSARIIKLSENGKVIVFIDTCFSAGAASEQLTEAVLKKDVGNVAIVASSRSNEVSMEDEKFGGGHGAFTSAVLEAMKGAVNKPWLTLDDLISYVQPRVEKLTDGQQHPETPFVSDVFQDALFYNGEYQPPVIGDKPLIAPLIKIISPENGTSLSAGSTTVLVEASDDAEIKPQSIKLLVNGKTIPARIAKAIALGDKALPGDAPLPAGHTQRKKFRIEAPLPQSNKPIILRAIITDESGQTARAKSEVLRQTIAPVKGTLHLLCIGVSTYRNADYNLEYANRDATELASLLTQQQGKQYARVEARVLTDLQATSHNIRSELKKLQAAKPDDMVMVFLSGHGVQSNDKFYFAAHDFEAANIASTSVAGTEIRELVEQVYAPKILLLDACRSGNQMGELGAQWRQTRVLGGEGTGTVVFTSCSRDQSSYEDDNTKHGYFALALLEAFSGDADGDHDGKLALNEMVSFVRKRVGVLAGGLPQTPMLSLPGDFDFVTTVCDVAPSDK